MATDNDVPELLGRKFERVSPTMCSLKIGARQICVYRYGSLYGAAVYLDGDELHETALSPTAQAAADAAWAWIVAQVEPIAKMIEEAKR